MILNRNEWRPRYYYIMKNLESNKLYLGQTVQDINKYLGSGTYWTNHCKSHGGYKKENIEVVYSKWFEDKDCASEFLVSIEEKYNEYWLSDEWANLIPENLENNPWYGPYISDIKIKNGTHSFLKKNRKNYPQMVEISKLTEIGTDKMNSIIYEKYGVYNAMKVPEISSRAGKSLSKTKNSKYWQENVKPKAIEKMLKSISQLDENGVNVWRESLKIVGQKNKVHNDRRVDDGTHQYLGGFYAVDKNGNTQKISKQQYQDNKISNDSSEWEFVHPSSNEGRKRRGIPPLKPKKRLPLEPKECLYCGKFTSPANHARWHNTNCKEYTS